MLPKYTLMSSFLIEPLEGLNLDAGMTRIVRICVQIITLLGNSAHSIYTGGGNESKVSKHIAHDYLYTYCTSTINNVRAPKDVQQE